MITYKEVYITPHMANDILERSKEKFSNRKINERVVANYANDMSNGNWMNNGENIKFDADETLIDGQHRLMAIVKCGIPQTLTAAYNVPIESVQTIDSGRIRSIENALQFQGIDFPSNALKIVRRKMILDMERFHVGDCRTNLGISSSMIIDEYLNNKEVYDEASAFGLEISRDSNRALISTEVSAIYLHLIYAMNYEKSLVEKFFHSLADSPRGKADIFTCTTNNLAKKKEFKGSNRIREYILCWNAMIKGNKIKRVSYSEWFLKPTAELARKDISEVNESPHCVGVGI